MTDPAREPPEPRGVCAVALVVGDELADSLGAELTEPERECVWIRQRVAPAVGGHRTRKITIQVQELRAGKVRTRVFGFAPVRIAELGAAVEQHEIVALDL